LSVMKPARQAAARLALGQPVPPTSTRPPCSRRAAGWNIMW